MTTFTDNYHIPLPAFSGDPWSQDYYNAFAIVDAVLYAFSGVSNIQGVWVNATTYTVGQRVTDTNLGTVWQCSIAHTSASTGTFLSDRTANPTYWAAFGFEAPSFGRKFTFATETADADPGSGVVRFNHATHSSVTQIFIDNLDSVGVDVTGWLDSFDDIPNGDIRGVLYIEVEDDPTTFRTYWISSTVTDGTGYRKLAVTYKAGANSGSIGAGATLLLSFVPAGADGAGSMDAAVYDPQGVVGDAFDVDNHIDGSVNGVYTLAERTKLSGVEALADVTDTANVTTALANGLEGLTTAEVDQLKNLNAVTITNAQWGYLGGAGAYAGTLLAPASEAAFKAAVNLEISVDVLGMGGGTLTGNLNLADNQLIRATFKDIAFVVNALGSISGAVEINAESGNFVTATISSATTLSFANFAAGSGFIFVVTNPTTNITWPTISWSGGVAPALSTTGKDIIVVIYDGTAYHGVVISLNSS